MTPKFSHRRPERTTPSWRRPRPPVETPDRTATTRRHRLSRPRTSGFVAAMSLLTVGGLALAAALPASAASVITHETAVSWVGGTPGSLDNGANASLEVVVNTNADDGVAQEVPNVFVTLTVANADIAALPGVCLTDGVDPVSSVSEDRHTLVCNLGTQQTGTAARVKVAVVSDGKNGDIITGTVTSPGTADLVVPPVPLVAGAGIDVVLDQRDDPYSGGITSPPSTGYNVYYGVALPVGVENLEGDVSFDLTLADQSGQPVAAVSDVRDPGCAATTTRTGVTLVPRSDAGSPLPSSCTITRTGSGTFHVTLSGFNQVLGASPLTAADGTTALRTDRRFVAAGIFTLTTDTFVSNASTEVTVSNVVATSVSGQAAAEVDASNNMAPIVITAPGAFFSSFNDHQRWADDLGLITGDTLTAIGVNSIYGDGPAAYSSSIVAGSCLVFDPNTSFTGEAGVGHALPGTDVQSVLEYTTSSTGNPSTFDCGTGTWSATAPADPATVTAVRATWIPANAAVGASGAIGNVNLSAKVTINDGLPIGTHVWEFGSFFANDQWNGSTVTSIVTPVDGAAYPGTTKRSDTAHVIGTKPFVTKTAAPASLKVGDVATYTITSAEEINGVPFGTVTYSLTDTMPAGTLYVPGSASIEPAAVTENADGTTTLLWSITSAHNVDTVITYQGTVSGAAGDYVNTVVQDDPAQGWGTPGSLAGSTAKATTTLVDAGSTTLVKTNAADTITIDGTNSWTLSLTNKDVVSQPATDTIDVLPYENDGYGSTFHGDLAVTGVTASDGTVYYTDADPTTIERDPAAASNGGFGAPSALWSTTKPEAVTAIRVIGGELPSGGTQTIQIDWAATGNLPGDTYNNIGFSRATHTQLKMTSAASPVLTIGPLVSIAKVADHLVHGIGTDAQYTLTVSNTGTVDAADAVVTDILPAGLTFVSASDGGTYDTDSRTITWTGLTVPAGGATSVTMIATVGADQAGQTIVNPAGVTIPGCETACVAPPATPCEADAMMSCAPIQVPAVEITKTVAETIVSAGDLVHWSVTVTNTGPTTLTDVPVKDVFDDTMTFVSADQGGVSDGAQEVTWTIPVLAPGESADLAVITQAKLVIPPPALLHNRVTVVPSETCVDETCIPVPTVPVDNQCTDTPVWACAEVPDPLPTVTFDKTVDKTVAAVGDTLTWEITARNNSATTALPMVVLVDEVPSDVQIISADQGGVITGQTVTWTVPLAAAETFTGHITGKALAFTGGRIVNPVHIANLCTTTDTDITKCVPGPPEVLHPCTDEARAGWACAVTINAPVNVAGAGAGGAGSGSAGKSMAHTGISSGSLGISLGLAFAFLLVGGGLLVLSKDRSARSLARHRAPELS